MKPTMSALDRLRSTVDLIDEQILELIERRLETACAIAAAKEEGEAGALKLCPTRETEVISRLQAQASTCSSEAIRHIWRELMAHTLQMQARTELVITGSDRDLHAPIRDAFGSAPKLACVETQAEAIARAQSSEAVAILRWPLPRLPDDLRLFRTLRDENGAPIAGAVGRVQWNGSEAALPEASPEWSPKSWRSRKASQMPIYADARALAEVEQQLCEAPPVIAFDEAAELKRALAKAAEGKAFLVQAGDCAESFAAFGAEPVRQNTDLLLGIGRCLPIEVVHVARAAGQFGKPRSAAVEQSDEGPIPTYRGDAVNDAERSRVARNPDPRRLLRAHAQSRATAKLLDAYASAAALTAGRTTGVYTSHEALLLNYEQALTRKDERTGDWWATSGHMVWIGDRTRNLDGAHVEYARGISNPVGVKCGPDLGPDELLRLADRLNPRNEAGRLVLIGRFGAQEIERRLPALMQATRSEGRKLLWATDPMHGNSRMLAGYKTRLLEDIMQEVDLFFEIAAAEGVHPGGVHLETTARSVTECVAAEGPSGPRPLGARYESLCDPRLNSEQSVEVAARVATCLRRHVPRLARAA